MLRKTAKSKSTTHPPVAVRSKAPEATRGELPTHDEIRLRAYELFCARNGSPGDPMADWLQAERELVAARQAGAATTTPADPPSIVTRQGSVRGAAR